MTTFKRILMMGFCFGLGGILVTGCAEPESQPGTVIVDWEIVIGCSVAEVETVEARLVDLESHLSYLSYDSVATSCSSDEPIIFAAVPPDISLLDDRIVEEDEQARSLLALVVSSLRYRLFAMLWHLPGHPGRLVPLALVSDNDEEFEKVVSELRQDYRAYLSAKAKIETEHTAAKPLKTLVMASPFQMEFMKDIILLLCTPIACSVAWLRERPRFVIANAFRGFRNTKIVDNCFNRLRFREVHDALLSGFIEALAPLQFSLLMRSVGAAARPTRGSSD